MKPLFLLVSLFGAIAAQASDCKSNRALAAIGFVVHGPSSFTQVTAPVLRRYELEKGSFVFETDARLFNGELHAPVLVTSYDDLRTPSSVMLGDILFTQNLDTNELYELRWFENGKRHVAYRVLSCAVGYIPMAENSLF